jgi:hypothetical protein
MEASTMLLVRLASQGSVRPGKGLVHTSVTWRNCLNHPSRPHASPRSHGPHKPIVRMHIHHPLGRQATCRPSSATTICLICTLPRPTLVNSVKIVNFEVHAECRDSFNLASEAISFIDLETTRNQIYPNYAGLGQQQTRVKGGNTSPIQ